MTEGERKIIENRRNKARKAEIMFANLVSFMRDGLEIRPSRASLDEIEIPKWLEEAA
jgi:hypothetical protein